MEPLAKNSPSIAGDSSEERFERPQGLKGVYYHPVTQLIMLGFVCFLCPGMFNALTGLGGSGQVNATTSANPTCSLYAIYAFFAFFSGTVNNSIGAKWALFLGTFGYALYVGSYLCIRVKTSLLNSSASDCQNNSVGNGTYIGFLVLTLIGVTIPLLMADPNKMIRTDGTKVVTPRSLSWKSEFYNLWVAVISNPMILLLFPMFFASNYFYTWQFNDYNSALFNIRARSLNNLMYWLSQIIGSWMIGLVLDSTRFRRRARAFAGWGILLTMVFIVHIWAYEYQKNYTRQSIPPNAQKMDIYDPAYPAHLIGAMSNDTNKLAMYAGFCDRFKFLSFPPPFYFILECASCLLENLGQQAYGVWMPSDYRSYLSFHVCGPEPSTIRTRCRVTDLPSLPLASLSSYMNIFLSTWCLMAAGLLFAFPMIYVRVRDTTVLDDEAILKRALEDAKTKEKVEVPEEKA
ncbi:hypothetical protein J3R83DRAFT_8851 [Lanmaoa asiatica]|nr:hypothetical protein J3R83DRAFT_8851 [Lanmaoa asiatica]